MSLTRDDLADIKQLMQATITAALVENNKVLKAEITNEMNARFDEQDEKLNEIMDAVGTDLNKHSAVLDDHEQRIATLEKHAA